MRQKFDIALKDIIKDVPRTFLKLLTGYDSGKFIDIQFPDIQLRQPDIVIEAPDGNIIHLEVQSTNEKIMLERMFLYAGFIYNQHKKLPIQIVLYVGNRPLKMANSVESDMIRYAYRLRDIREIDCSQLLVSNAPEDVLLAILCKTDDVEGAIKKILDRFYLMPPKERENYIRKLLYLSELRMLYTKVKAEVMNMPITIDIEDSKVFKDVFIKGKREGKLEGKLEGMLEGMLDLKYGSEGLELMKMVKNIDKTDILEEFKELIKRSTSVIELQAYLNKNV
ncbi:MAG: hypothetical protein HQL06_11740 [Nitrospirae bacterium]|nr:hypothetical protein [Nitrospirota bacterium]